MAILMGLDTGGTYTDAVLYDDTAPSPGIVSKAKALTTRHDLSIGIGGAISNVMVDRDATQISMVSISTTLATNALVEGQGGRVCLVLIGFDTEALDRAGLGAALGSDPVVFVAGGHTPTGARQAPLDEAALKEAVRTHADAVDAFAVIAFFGTRDPVDEKAAQRVIQATCERPVTCGHQLAASLGGPKRALTALLNARLIGMISHLIAATNAILSERGITAPLMLVRGDGSLVSADFARNRPIETILSGPAASLVGAAHLIGARNAVVSDIGGTTTDIAILEKGRPALSPDGARVGGHHTMVEAVAMTTHGLGGDSDVRIDESSLQPRLILGPRRLVPVSLLATEFPHIHAKLDEQLARPMPSASDARFVFATTTKVPTDLRKVDEELLRDLSTTPRSVGSVLRSRMHGAALNRLVARGLVQIAGPTPSDASHVLDEHTPWDSRAARAAMALLARGRDAGGRPVADTAESAAVMVRRTLERRSAEVLLDAALMHDGVPASVAQTPLLRTALDGHCGVTRLNIGLDRELVGLGASAGLYYPAIADTLGTQAVIPKHADVANAIGAVVGQIRIQQQAFVSQPSDGLFRAHLSDGASEHSDLESARKLTFDFLKATAIKAADQAGAQNVEVSEDWSPKTAMIEGREMFIEAVATVTATGRPKLSGH